MTDPASSTEGFVEEGEKAAAHKPAERQPEIVVEVGAEPYDSTESLTEPMAESLEEMTKSENYNSDQKPLQRDTRARTR